MSAPPARPDAAERARILERVGAYYTGALARHGPTARGVDWNSPESQGLRFDQLLRVCDPRRAGSVNDYGCGYGALLHRLAAAGFAGSYTGFDVAPAMVAEARRLHAGRPRTRFVDDERLLEPADYTLASGIFNVKLDVDGGTWRAYVLDTLDRIRSLSRKGFAFNALTVHSDADRMRPDLHYADPLELFERCRAYSRHLALLHDYPLYEFTIVVLLQGAP